jgi:hypothetical protein
MSSFCTVDPAGPAVAAGEMAAETAAAEAAAGEVGVEMTAQRRRHRTVRRRRARLDGFMRLSFSAKFW